MRSTPLLPSLLGRAMAIKEYSRVVTPDRALSMGQIELKYVIMLNRIA